jgi:beta-lactamase class C
MADFEGGLAQLPPFPWGPIFTRIPAGKTDREKGGCLKRAALILSLGVTLGLALLFCLGLASDDRSIVAAPGGEKAAAVPSQESRTVASLPAAEEPPIVAPEAGEPVPSAPPAAVPAPPPPAAPPAPKPAFTHGPMATSVPRPTVSAETAEEKKRDRAFSLLINRAAKTHDFVGLAVAVVRHGKVTLLSLNGPRAVGKNDKVTSDTLFRIASLSKGFAASLAALSIEEGHLSWNEKVASRVPQFHLATQAETSAVTVADILSHRTGLPPNAFDNKLEAGVPIPDILGSYREVPLICPVGSCYAYQNVAFNMIATLLEDAEGQPYETLVKTRLFDPLAMKTASYGRDGLVHSANWAHPHLRAGRHSWRETSVDEAYYNIPAAGGVNASINDLSHWLVAQMGDAPDVLPFNIVKELHQPVVETPAETRRWRDLQGRMKETFYGYGFRVYDYAGHTVISHAGGVKGYSAQIAFLPESDTGIAILANAHAQRTGRILPAFLDLELGLRDRDWLMLKDPG